MQRNRFLASQQVVVLLLLFMLACTKETSQENYSPDRFMKVFSGKGESLITGMVEANDGTLFLSQVNLVDGIIDILHTSKHGEVLKKSTVTLAANEFMVPRGVILKSGEIAFTSQIGSDYIKVSADGEILKQTKWSSQVQRAVVGLPYIEESGNLLIGVSEYNVGGEGVGVFRVDQEGEFVDVFNINLDAYNKAIFSLAVAKMLDGKMLLVGDCKPKNFKYTDKAKLFVAEYDELTDQISKVMFIDEFEDSEDDFFIGALPNENGFVVLTGGTSFGQFPGPIPAKEFELFFISNDLQLIDRRRYDVGAINVVPSSIVETQDGGYLVSGYTSSVNQREYKGVMAKITKSGLLTKHRIFPYLAHLEVYHGLEMSDGNYLFGGGSLTFGNGKESMTPVIFKTDTDGKIE